MAKSMMVVVPPKAAARVPVSKSSLEVVPPNGMSRCVWASMPPGSSSIPEASMTRPAASAGREGAMSRIFSPSTRMSAATLRSAVTTVPFRMSVVGIQLSFGDGKAQSKRDENGARQRFHAALHSGLRQHCAQPVEKGRISGEPGQAHGDMHGRQQNRLLEDRLARRDELRQKCEVKEGDFGI